MDHNTLRSYYGGKSYNSLHAERNVLLQYANRIMKSRGWFNQKKHIKGKAIMYVCRSHSCTGIGIAKPCETCQKFIYNHGIKTVKYTDVINGEKVICTMKLRS